MPEPASDAGPFRASTIRHALVIMVIVVLFVVHASAAGWVVNRFVNESLADRLDDPLVAFVVRDDNDADLLRILPLATMVNGVIIEVPTRELNEPARRALEAFYQAGGRCVAVIGSDFAISPSVVNQISETEQFHMLPRAAGRDRAETNIMALREFAREWKPALQDACLAR